MKRLSVVLAVVIAALISLVATTPAVPVLVSISFNVDHIVRVVDGDTVVVAGQPKSVRVLGINSPETKDPRKLVECGGPEASAWAKRELPPGTAVHLFMDATQGSTDKYGRELRYIQYKKGSDWVDFSVQAARSGNAKAYVYAHKPVLHYQSIKAAEDFARENRLGLWGHC